MDRPRVKLNTQIIDEASAWFVECRAGDLDDSGRREFDRWLRKSPEHLAAYLEVAAIWNEGPSLDSSRNYDADTLIADSRRHLGNLVALSGTSAVEKLDEKVLPNQTFPTFWPHRPLSRRSLIAAAVAIAAVVIAGVWAKFEFSGSSYATGIGEQRSLELADGSTVSMNSRSKVRVRYSKAERLVDLLEGQALFHVAKDRVRPFIVRADDTRVRAVGTQFDVYERPSGTVVTVLEGEVAVLAPLVAQAQPQSPTTTVPAQNPAPISVSAGEQLTVTPRAAKKSDHPNLAAATAWTQRQLIFASATLTEVAEEFNRYNERQLVIRDPDLLTFHISGVFSSTDPESLIRFLRDRPGVKVTEEGSQIRVSKDF